MKYNPHPTLGFTLGLPALRREQAGHPSPSSRTLQARQTLKNALLALLILAGILVLAYTDGQAVQQGLIH